MVASASPKAGAALAPFIEFLGDQTAEKMEELYASTFDNSQTAALELGWHVFGETYDRGAFLVRMRALLRDNDVAEGSELPDHLSLALMAMSRCDEAEALALAKDIVAPAVEKVCVSLAAGGNPYEAVMDAVVATLELHQLESNGCN